VTTRLILGLGVVTLVVVDLSKAKVTVLALLSEDVVAAASKRSSLGASTCGKMMRLVVVVVISYTYTEKNKQALNTTQTQGLGWSLTTTNPRGEET